MAATGGGDMNRELIMIIEQLGREKGIDKEILFEALESALLSASRKSLGPADNVRIQIHRKTGQLSAHRRMKVVDEVTDPKVEISLEEAKQLNTEAELDDELELDQDLPPQDFGRIAAQTAKQVIFQRMREAERDIMYDEYHERVGDIVTGIVQQSDHRYTLVDLGKVEALLPASEQIYGERYDHGARIKVFIVEVRKTNKGPQILVSRTHPGLLKRLFELEVPEIAEGYVEIKAVAREPGQRSKIAVVSHEKNIDPVGACVGAKGSRVRMVVNELRGEKVDIIPWSEEPVQFVMSALSPAKVKDVIINEEEETAEVIVPDSMLSLAIGKEGQNARLAAKLTGWRIDIRSESQDARVAAASEEELAAAEDVLPEEAEAEAALEETEAMELEEEATDLAAEEPEGTDLAAEEPEAAELEEEEAADLEAKETEAVELEDETTRSDEADEPEFPAKDAEELPETEDE